MDIKRLSGVETEFIKGGIHKSITSKVTIAPPPGEKASVKGPGHNKPKSGVNFYAGTIRKNDLPNKDKFKQIPTSAVANYRNKLLHEVKEEDFNEQKSELLYSNIGESGEQIKEVAELKENCASEETKWVENPDFNVHSSSTTFAITDQLIKTEMKETENEERKIGDVKEMNSHDVAGNERCL